MPSSSINFGARAATLLLLGLLLPTPPARGASNFVASSAYVISATAAGNS